VNSGSIEPPGGSEKRFPRAVKAGFYAFSDDGKTTGNGAFGVPHSKDLGGSKRG